MPMNIDLYRNNQFRFEVAKINDKAFSLVEVILALAIFSMAIGGILGILASSSRSVGEVTNRSMALNVLREAVSLIEREMEITIADGQNFNDTNVRALFPEEFNINGQVAGAASNVLTAPYYRVVIPAGTEGISLISSGGNTVGAGITLEVQWPLSETEARRSKQTLKHVLVFQ